MFLLFVASFDPSLQLQAHFLDGGYVVAGVALGLCLHLSFSGSLLVSVFTDESNSVSHSRSTGFGTEPSRHCKFLFA